MENLKMFFGGSALLNDFLILFSVLDIGDCTANQNCSPYYSLFFTDKDMKDHTAKNGQHEHISKSF